MARKANLSTALNNKALALRATETQSLDDALTYVAAAGAANNKAEESHLHATAVEQAIAIITKAGVTL